MTSTATVAANPLSVSASSLIGAVGTAVSGTIATFTDTKPGTSASTLSATITWGDGSTSAGAISAGASAGTYVVTGSHSYNLGGTYATSIQVSDTAGAVASANGSAAISGVTPTVTPASISTTEGQAFSGNVATFTCTDPIAYYSATITWGDGDAECHWHRAAALFALGRIDEAGRAYQQASRLRPESAAYQNDFGVVLARQGRLDEAAGQYREAIRLKADFPDAHNNLGNALRNKGGLDEAIACYREAIRLRPAYPEAHNNLGIALRQQGKLAEAAAAYQEALRLRPAYPEAHNNLGFALAAQGRPDAAVACFQQAIRLRPGYAEAFSNLGGAFADLGRHDEAANAFREAIRLRPQDARAHKCLGIALAKQNALDEAVRSYREALRLRPDYADAHNDLGIALARQNRFEDAAASYGKALEFRPNYAEAHNNLGNTLRNLGRFDEAIASYDRALALKPNDADAFNNRGIAFAEVARFDEAIASYTRCIKLRPHHVDARLNRALTWLRQGNLALGWAEYEWRLRKRNLSSRPPTQPAWNGFPPDGLRVLLLHEQGLGDTLQFIRYAPLLKRLGATVIFECPPELLKLLERAPGIDVLYPQGEEPPEHDVHAPLLTLPGLLGTALDAIPADVPYLHADAGLVESWRNELAEYPEFKVGINWQGNPGYAGDLHRSIPLRHDAPLAKVPGVRLFSLQKQDGTEQLRELAGAFPLVELGGRFDDSRGPFMDSAAVLKNLDLFITSDTAVAHLAGALGVPVWLVLSAAPGWQWMFGREDSPWYPTMRLFRQTRLLDWPPVFERLAQELARLVPPALRARSIGVRVSPGELYERIAVLEVELEQDSDETSRRAIRADLVSLETTRDRLFSRSNELRELAEELRAVIRSLQVAEAAVLECERTGDFDPRFVAQAMVLAGARERSAALRRRVDAMLVEREQGRGIVTNEPLRRG